MTTLFAEKNAASIPLCPVVENNFNDWVKSQDDFTKNWLNTNQFSAKVNSFCSLPNKNGSIEKVFFGAGAESDFWSYATLCENLPKGVYHLEGAHNNPELASLAWGLATYQFTKYKSSDKVFPTLVAPDGVDLNHVENLIKSIYLIRDLITTPAEDMAPEHLGDAVEMVAKEFKAKVTQIVGDDLLKKNYPAVHAVGRASVNKPRMIDMTWGDDKHPKLTLVGKGVCFDTGGLDLKPDQYMRLMKKDMAGAAHALALARLVMAAELPVRLRVLIPAVENSVSGNAHRPGDVFKTRSGKTIEIGHTDAEGRVILADALFEGASEAPDLMIDFASLTGAARVALGTEIPVLFTDDEQLGRDLVDTGREVHDLVWQLPLHDGYRSLIDSPIADVCNDAASPYGGAITAALFLKEFVGTDVKWAHIDLMAWNVKSKPGRPEGGDAMGLRTVFRYLTNYYNFKQ